MAARLFGGAGATYAERYGTRPETFAAISVKSRRHAANNPYAVFRDPVTVEQVLDSPAIFGPLTRLQCCPPTCGAAAAVVVQRGVRRGPADCGRDVAIAAQAMTTDTSSTFDGDAMRSSSATTWPARPPARSTRQSGVGPEDIPVVELHDCFTTNELLSLRGARADPGGHRGEVHPRRRQHLRRPGGHQPVRRPAVQGPPARRDRPGAVRRAGLAAARRGRRPAGRRASTSRCSTTSVSAAPPSSPSTRRSADGRRPRRRPRR